MAQTGELQPVTYMYANRGPDKYKWCKSGKSMTGNQDFEIGNPNL